MSQTQLQPTENKPFQLVTLGFLLDEDDEEEDEEFDVRLGVLLVIEESSSSLRRSYTSACLTGFTAEISM
jgi:hypothetical protein